MPNSRNNCEDLQDLLREARSNANEVAVDYVDAANLLEQLEEIERGLYDDYESALTIKVKKSILTKLEDALSDAEKSVRIQKRIVASLKSKNDTLFLLVENLEEDVRYCKN